MNGATLAHAVSVGDLNERDFYPTIVQHAKLLGYSVVHIPPTRGDRPGSWRTAVSEDGIGFPDFLLHLAATSRHPSQFLAIEVKRDARVSPNGKRIGRPGKLTEKQAEWRVRFIEAGVRHEVFYVPSQLDELLRLLSDLAL